MVQCFEAGGSLVQVLLDWCLTLPSFHLYDLSRWQLSRALALVNANG